MAGGLPANSVWTAMSYTPPRGRCNHKSSLMSPACPCLRFMLHPVKAATSFECDGCGHHASFHSLENREEDEVVRKWQEMEKARVEEQQKNVPGPGSGAARKKRKMIEGKNASAGAEVREVLEIEDDAETEAGDDVFTFRAESSSTGGASRTTTTGRKKRGSAIATTSGRGR